MGLSSLWIVVPGLTALVLWLLCLNPASPLPPGPKRLWFVGNLFQMPRVEPFKTYGEWSKIYGSILYFQVFGRHFIVLNSLPAAVELLEQRSSIYSTRPRYVMAGELIEKEKYSMVFMKNSPRLKECRRITRSWMGKESIGSTASIQEKAAVKLLQSLLNHPSDFSDHIRRHSGAVVLKLVYGIECLEHDDPHIALEEHVCGLTSEAMRQGKWLCDFFPSLAYVPSWLPGAGFRRWGEYARAVTLKLINAPFEEVCEAAIAGTANPCWVLNELFDADGNIKPKEHLDGLIAASGSLYAAGIDTTVSALRTFFLMMARYPEIQRKAQAHVDSIVPGYRLPTLSDRDSLPYMTYIVKEVLRIASIVPLMPHSLDVDDNYQGYLIPKGSSVIVNTWHIFHDPSNYPDPDEFRPERFDSSGASGVSQPDPEQICFGLGRRTCVGIHFAHSWIFLIIAHVLSTFDIHPIKGEDGITRPPPVEFEASHIRFPSNFQCQIVPRSPAKEKLIHELGEW